MATKQATSSSWQHLPLPDEREPLGFDALFTDADAEHLMLGLIPQEMEDKWFVYFENGWLRFHRSWTGYCIYALRLDGCPVGVRVVESWANRNPQQHTGTDMAEDRARLRSLIDRLLCEHGSHP
jgi:hypothetical protein